jgi:O6-methylguanine-DNA--protein-cysteine methyltransferase
MTETRRPKEERRLMTRAADLLGQWGEYYPVNPCDTKLLFAFAKIGNDVRKKVTQALNEITAGPHADFDYIEIAAEALDDAAAALRRFK